MFLFLLFSYLNDRISIRLFLSPSSASACITTCFDLSISATAISQHQPTKGWDLILVEAFVHPNNLLMTCFSFFCKRKGVSRTTQSTEVDD
ncbi:hypothetical protein H0E87_020895, partial [Populus deltoides]